MKISRENEGSVVSLTGYRNKNVLIELFSDKYVIFRHENGDRQSEESDKFEGEIVNDPYLLAEFHENCNFGIILNAAIESSLKKINDIREDDYEKKTARDVLSNCKAQKKWLEERISARCQIKKPGIDSIIKAADKKRAVQNSFDSAKETVKER